MLTRRIIPCLDVKDGRVVKGVRFRELRDAGDPAERAALYEREGADELVILDIAATPQRRAHTVETVRAVRQTIGLPLTVGGGVRCTADAARLLGAGADKVAINTAAVHRPALLSEMAAQFGRQCTVLALDAARNAFGGFDVVVRSGCDRTGLDVAVWAEEATRLGAGEILLTSFDRDGTRSGFDLELLRAVCERVSVPVIASGGARDVEDLAAALEAGASAVLAASIFHDDGVVVLDLKRKLADLGFEVRT